MKKDIFKMAQQMENLGLRQNKMSKEEMKFGLAPWVGEAPKVLILGTLPSDVSLINGQYYQNSTNRFWEIMHNLFGGSPTDNSKEFLYEHKIALWDCLKYAQRKGSTDKGIARGSEIPNDISEFLREHPTIKHIVLNGSSGTKRYFDRFEKHLYSNYDVIVLPQTSKLNESGKYKISFEEKLFKWEVLKDVVNAQP